MTVAPRRPVPLCGPVGWNKFKAGPLVGVGAGGAQNALTECAPLPRIPHCPGVGGCGLREFCGRGPTVSGWRRYLGLGPWRSLRPAPPPAQKSPAESSPLPESRGAPGPPHRILAPADQSHLRWGLPPPRSLFSPWEPRGGCEASAGAAGRAPSPAKIRRPQAVRCMRFNGPFYTTGFPHRNTRAPTDARQSPLSGGASAPRALAPRAASSAETSPGSCRSPVSSCLPQASLMDICPHNLGLFPWVSLFI